MGVFKIIIALISISLFPFHVSATPTLTLLQKDPTKPSSTTLVTATMNDAGLEIIADSIGKTLYVFDYDLHKSAPTCAENCAEMWPPYLITTEESLHLSKPLGTIKRTDGKVQLTYKDRPTYTYAYDRVSGGDLGNGNNGVWHHIEFQTP